MSRSKALAALALAVIVVAGGTWMLWPQLSRLQRLTISGPLAPPATPPAPRPMALGMNVPGINYWASTVPFANLVIGSNWLTNSWHPLPETFQDKTGNLIGIPEDGRVFRFITVPPTGTGTLRVRCRFSGSGTLMASGEVADARSFSHGAEFTVVNHHKRPGAWLVARDVRAGAPMTDLDCRDVRLAPTVRFRPEFVRSLAGYTTIRFTGWQNANDNVAVAWRDRHGPTDNRIDQDGASVEDMLALCAELDASPWFVMPWNADDDYISSFAKLVAAKLPARKSAYVEVGNEVWNTGFPVAKQALQEGQAEGLGASPREALMRRYAERSVAVMRLWERAFAGRSGLVRVLATQHVVPDSAKIALSFRDTAAHIDAVATAPYFGPLLGGGGHDVESIIARLSTDLAATLAQTRENRSVARSFGKRYIAYEGGQGLILPVDIDVMHQVQYDPRMYQLYVDYLDGWKADGGDLLCLLTSYSLPGAYGSWGLAEWEDERPADAPKLRAVRERLEALRQENRPAT